MPVDMRLALVCGMRDKSEIGFEELRWRRMIGDSDSPKIDLCTKVV